MMNAGAAQADVAMLVVNATNGEFETGFDAGGQTREHTMLSRSLGKWPSFYCLYFKLLPAFRKLATHIDRTCV